MTKAASLISLVFFVLTLYLNSALTADSDDYSVIDARRSDGGKYSPLWFGPRIGRKKRNPSENILKTVDRDEMEALLYEALNNPSAFVGLDNGKRIIDFTPRTGREFTAADNSIYYDQKPVGRELSLGPPRMGRKNLELP
ncbi:hypothetical protein NQ315_004841 [Exocentrus adspersus]|uniref:Uncharacterized protein n=1 Tax=Exocentrus adspersus TaxID=1586481 RepID=A0AAV8W212_9CUCU|nr:hypothetical protein NQ315_004841 [Exocentrus adspersus]